MMAIWVLVRHYNFSPEYIDALPPVERDIYLNFGIKEAEDQNKEMEGGHPS